LKTQWSPLARRDLRDVYLRILPENPQAARVLQERIRASVPTLQGTPQIGRPGRLAMTAAVQATFETMRAVWRAARQLPDDHPDDGPVWPDPLANDVSKPGVIAAKVAPPRAEAGFRSGGQ
jgi:plasmid stabilization system protein ParE